jgi:hypothetical protein
MGKVRMWIVSDQLYAHNLQPVLIARDAPHDAPNNLDEQQNKVLNSLDRFCSLISLAQSLASDRQSRKRLTHAQSALLDKLSYKKLWAGRGRKDLEEYVEKIWNELLIEDTRSGRNWGWLLVIAGAILTIITVIYFIGNSIGTINAKIDTTDKKVDELKSDVTKYITNFNNLAEEKDGLRSQVNKIESKIGAIDSSTEKVNNANINKITQEEFDKKIKELDKRITVLEEPRKSRSKQTSKKRF